MQSAVAAIIVYFGGTQGLQNMLIIAALPFSIVVILMGVSFFKSAHREQGYWKKQTKKKEGQGF